MKKKIYFIYLGNHFDMDDTAMSRAKQKPTQEVCYQGSDRGVCSAVQQLATNTESYPQPLTEEDIGIAVLSENAHNISHCSEIAVACVSTINAVSVMDTSPKPDLKENGNRTLSDMGEIPTTLTSLSNSVPFPNSVIGTTNVPSDVLNMQLDGAKQNDSPESADNSSCNCVQTDHSINENEQTTASTETQFACFETENAPDSAPALHASASMASSNTAMSPTPPLTSSVLPVTCDMMSQASTSSGEMSSPLSKQLAVCLESESSRSLRKRGKRQCADVMTCPVCHARVAYDKARDHLENETSRLQKWLQSYLKKSEKRMSTDSPTASVSACGEAGYRESERAVRYQTYQRIKRNRHRRGPVKRSGQEGVECPVCNERIEGSQEQVNQHVNLCLSKNDDDVEVDVIGSDDASDDDSYEEYEWAGQKRVRVTSMAGGNLATMGYQVARREESGSEVELDIEDDQTEIYGASQYSEADLIPCQADEPKEERQRQALRQALLTNANSSQVSASSSNQLPGNAYDGEPSNQHSNDMQLSNSGDNQSSLNASSNEPNICMNSASNTQSLTNGVSHLESEPNNAANIEPDTGQTKNEQDSNFISSTKVECLKRRIKDLEKSVERSNKFRCLICMESYVNPVTSVQCWHVYCEECWLRTLGVKKLCPQCNMITHPAELRKIYL